MKVKFLGTIAAEGGPALFCNCRYCQEAARRGGKDIRTRSQILVNEDLLVDFPADTYLHKLRHGLNLSKVRYLLITHSHRDHFYPEDICNRGAQSAHDMVEPTLDIYSNQATKDLFDVHAVGNLQRAVAEGLNWNVLSEFEYVHTERYEFWSLKAQHMKNENALFYLIKQGNKAFLQCNDTGVLFEENYEFLSALGVKIDVVALDCTMGAQDRSYWGHMNLKECMETVERMRSSNFVKPTTRFVLTHFCHNGILMHDEYEEFCKPYGVDVAYDGMEIEF
jgi:phosphoribosyl 1,2-cyclic phosphate phosphodiesterase